MLSDPQTWTVWLELILAFSAVIGVAMAVFRWSNKRLERRIIHVIEDSTSQIKKNANGGQSLNDLHQKVDRVVEDVSVLRESVVFLENEIDGIGRRRAS